MSKKILCAVLALLLAASCCVTGTAAEYADDTFVTVTVWNEQYRQLQVIPKGADLLFSAEDLAWMSGMTMTQTDTLIRYTRGFKTVTVQVKDPDRDDAMPGYQEVVCAMVSTNTKALLSAAQKVDGTWYLSGASLLPWMNVQVQVDENQILVRPSSASVWDEWDSFSLRDYSFDFVECCREIGIQSKDVEAAAYVRDNGLKMLLDLDINNNGTTYQSTQNYLDLFDDFFKDKSATDRAHSKTKECLKTLINATDAVTLTLLAAAPECAVISEAANKVLKTGEMFLDFYTYVSLFNEDNTQKLRIMDSFADELIPNSVSLDKNMKKAADKIRDRYRDLWQGVMQKAMTYTMDASVGALNSNFVLKALDLKWSVERPLNQKINRIGMYDTIAASAKHTYNEGFGSYSEADIHTLLDNGVLYLYCVEQNYRAMADYIAQKSVGTREQMLTYIARADAAEEAAAELLHLSLFSSYDASDTGKWTAQSKALLEGFEDLDRQRAVVSDLGVSVDNAILMTGLLDMSLRDLRWTRADMDRDGCTEILALCEQDGETTLFVMDANNKAMSGISIPSMLYGSCALLDTSDGVSYHPTYGLEQGGIYSWNGHEWTLSFSWDEGWAEQNGEMVFKDYFYCDGVECTYSEYSQKLEAAKIRDVRYEEREGTLALDCPQMEEVFLTGDPDSLVRQLNNHMKGKDTLLAAVDVNFNLDEDTDRLYIVKNALSEMLLFSRMNDESESMPYRSYLDLEWTLVLAERQNGGVRVRTYRVDERFLEDMTAADCNFEGESLSIGENDFYYQSDGKPFIDAEAYFAAQEPCLLEFLDMTEEEAVSTIDGYYYYEEGNLAEGCWAEGYMVLTFASDAQGSSRVSTVAFYPSSDRHADIDGVVNTGFTRAEIWEKIQPTTPWSPPAPTPAPGDGVLYYGTEFVYARNGMDYAVTLCFLDESPDAPMTVISIVPKT